MKKLILFIVTCLTCTYFTDCESCNRNLHSLKSDLGGGLYRRVTLLDYNGDTLKTWEGKFDVQFTD